MTPPDGPASHPEILLDEADRLLRPLIRLLVANGVAYPQFVHRLKGAFLDAARAELDDRGARKTDSALSLLSGLHRKDVRAAKTWESGATSSATHGLSFAAEVFTRWLHEPSLRDAEGSPRPLPRSGPAPSFDALVSSVSKDFHARSVLDELLRLGLVRVEGETIEPLAQAFVPREGFRELAFFFGENLRDHLSAGTANLRQAAAGQTPEFLEQSVFADELTEESAEALGRLARVLWRNAFDRIVEEATRYSRRDANRGGRHRVRFGTYYYAEPVQGRSEQDSE